MSSTNLQYQALHQQQHPSQGAPPPNAQPPPSVPYQSKPQSYQQEGPQSYQQQQQPYQPQQPIHAQPIEGPVHPKIKGQPQILGLVSDPGLHRDSGGSSRFGDRVFWTYRDTQLCNSDGSVRQFPIISSTASWSNYNQQGGPDLQAVNGDPLKCVTLRQYGNNSEHDSYFHQMQHICETPTGNAGNGSRIPLWPDQPPLVTEQSPDGRIVAYTWVPLAHIGPGLTVIVEHPGAVLYRMDYHPGQGHHTDLPKVTVVNEQFWKQGEILFGTYGTLVKDGIAYLWGRTPQHITSVARCLVNEIENRDAYEYWVDGRWTRQRPERGQSGIELVDSNAGGQGTYYWNEHWGRYVWIGGDIFPGAETYICTAPEPQGPWTKPFHFYTGPRGNHPLGAYSVQAHPSLATNPHKNDMYITYTRSDEPERPDIPGYTTPLIYVEFE